MKLYVIIRIVLLRGLVDYYWHYDSDPSQNITGFFFACGQVNFTCHGTRKIRCLFKIGAVGGLSYPNQCVCEDIDVCTNCYRWWDAVALGEQVLDKVYKNFNMCILLRSRRKFW